MTPALLCPSNKEAVENDFLFMPKFLHVGCGAAERSDSGPAREEADLPQEVMQPTVTRCKTGKNFL